MFRTALHLHCETLRIQMYGILCVKPNFSTQNIDKLLEIIGNLTKGNGNGNC